MAITIDDIAKEANVSIATVSRVINGSKTVSPELRNRVMEAVNRNHFHWHHCNGYLQPGYLLFGKRDSPGLPGTGIYGDDL